MDFDCCKWDLGAAFGCSNIFVALFRSDACTHDGLLRSYGSAMLSQCYKFDTANAPREVSLFRGKSRPYEGSLNTN